MPGDSFEILKGIVVNLLSGRNISFDNIVVIGKSMKGVIRFDGEVLPFKTWRTHEYNLLIEETPQRQYECVLWLGGGVKKFITPDVTGSFITALIPQLEGLVKEMNHIGRMEEGDPESSNKTVFDAFLQLVRELAMSDVLLVSKEIFVDLDDMKFGGSPTGRGHLLSVNISDLGEINVRGHDGVTMIWMHGSHGCFPGVYFLDGENRLIGPAIRGRTDGELMRSLRKTLSYTKSKCVKNALIAGLSLNFLESMANAEGKSGFRVYLYGNEFELWVLVDDSDLTQPVTYTFSLKANTENEQSGRVDCSDIRVGVDQIINALKEFAVKNSTYQPWQCRVAENLCRGGFLLIEGYITDYAHGKTTADSIKANIPSKDYWTGDLNLSMDKISDEKYECMIWRGGGVREVTLQNLEVDIIHMVVPAIHELVTEFNRRPGIDIITVNDLSSEDVFTTLRLFLHGLVSTTFDIPWSKDVVDFDLIGLRRSPPDIQPCVIIRIEDISKILKEANIHIIGHDGATRIVMHGFIRPVHFPGIYFTNGFERDSIRGPPIRGRNTSALLHGLNKVFKKQS